MGDKFILCTKKLSKRKAILIFFLLIILTGFLLPEKIIVPVKGASASDWNAHTFWYEPWGVSGVHKGIDIFGKKGQSVVSATHGLVIFKGDFAIGGKVILVLGPKWRFHYYAHLDAISASGFDFLAAGEVIGTVGDSGNAKGKQPHLHYSILTPFPYFWRFDTTTQGWKKMFYLNPHSKLI